MYCANAKPKGADFFLMESINYDYSRFIGTAAKIRFFICLTDLLLSPLLQQFFMPTAA